MKIIEQERRKGKMSFSKSKRFQIVLESHSHKLSPQKTEICSLKMLEYISNEFHLLHISPPFTLPQHIDPKRIEQSLIRCPIG